MPRVLKTLASLLAAATCCAGVAAAPAAAERAAQVEIGKVRLAAPQAGRGALLVPVRYPIQLAGHRVMLRVSLRHGDGTQLRTWTLRQRPRGGPAGLPERRGGFAFVYRVGYGPKLAPMLRRGTQVRVEASGRLDANRDGLAELDSSDRERQVLGPSGGSRLCSTLPGLNVRPRQRLSVPLPSCTGWVRWRLADRPDHGRARIRDGRLIYRAGPRFRGTASVRLVGRTLGAVSSAAGAPAAAAQIVVGTGSGAVVRAIGDSVTAGFGYYDNGSPMPFPSLLRMQTVGEAPTTTPAPRTRPRPANGLQGSQLRPRLRPRQQRLLGGAVGERVRRHQLRELRGQRLRTGQLGAGRAVSTRRPRRSSPKTPTTS